MKRTKRKTREGSGYQWVSKKHNVVPKKRAERKQKSRLWAERPKWRKWEIWRGWDRNKHSAKLKEIVRLHKNRLREWGYACIHIYMMWTSHHFTHENYATSIDGQDQDEEINNNSITTYLRRSISSFFCSFSFPLFAFPLLLPRLLAGVTTAPTAAVLSSSEIDSGKVTEDRISVERLRISCTFYLRAAPN